MNTDKLNDKEFVEYCKDARRKGATTEQWGYAELLMKACSRLTAAEEALSKALEPIKEWYGGGTEGNRSDIEILNDAIADLQKDRAEVLRLKETLEKAEEEREQLKKWQIKPTEAICLTDLSCRYKKVFKND